MNVMPTDLRPIAPFDYSALPAEHAKVASEAADAIKASGKQIGGYVLAIGEQLTAVKGVLDHGQFGEWLAAEFSWTVRSAQNYMSAWAAFGDKCETVSHLPPTIIYALASPSTPSATREDVVERLEAGERLENAAIQHLIRGARAQARAAAEEAKLTDKERKNRARQKRRREQQELQRQREREERERERQEAAAAADEAVAFLKRRLGDDFPKFLELAKRAGSSSLASKLGIGWGF